MEKNSSSDVRHGVRALAADHQRVMKKAEWPVVQRCVACNEVHFPPQLRCRRCASDEFTWDVTSGKGTVATWVTVHHREETASMAIPGWLLKMVPYSTVFVKLNEYPGVRVAALLMHHGDRIDLVAGDPVKVRVEDVAGRELPVCHLLGG